ncbi:hypothetical protein LI291_05535 [Intestinibacillus massiliensis]|mgnify:CR=1 FL=1|nr:hypothetical protein [Intestinibacillus massiliensis]
MSDINFSSIYDGVTLAVHAAFPAAHVYGGNVRQGIKPGDFNVIMPSAGHVKQVGRRYLRTPTLDVIYYPATGMGDCYQTADILVRVLESITTPEGDLIHCTSCEWSVDDGVLHVLVGYDHYTYTPLEQELMETLDIEMEG